MRSETRVAGGGGRVAGEAEPGEREYVRVPLDDDGHELETGAERPAGPPRREKFVGFVPARKPYRG